MQAELVRGLGTGLTGLDLWLRQAGLSAESGVGPAREPCRANVGDAGSLQAAMAVQRVSEGDVKCPGPANGSGRTSGAEQMSSVRQGSACRALGDGEWGPPSRLRVSLSPSLQTARRQLQKQLGSSRGRAEPQTAA